VSKVARIVPGVESDQLSNTISHQELVGSQELILQLTSESTRVRTKTRAWTRALSIKGLLIRAWLADPLFRTEQHSLGLMRISFVLLKYLLVGKTRFWILWDN
jgi:hypothetical protein